MEQINSIRLIISGSFIVTSLMGMFFGYPLWQGKVPPNGITGFRTARTLADPVLWNQVNTATGRTMFFVSVVLGIATLIVHFTVAKERPLVGAAILMCIMIGGFLGVAIQGLVMSR